jgi:hypothetical protein
MRLDEAVDLGLPDALSAATSPWLSDTDPGIWLIRRLEVGMDINVAWERNVLIRAWAMQIARALHAALQDGGDGQTVLWFPNRAAYLARFLVDAAAGWAWGKWYYESFEGLRLLPTSAVLRTAICEEPAVGQAALLQLTADELQKVLRALTVQDMRRILEGLAENAPASEELRCFQAVWAVWPTLPGVSFSAGEEWRSALRLYLAVRLAQADIDGLPLLMAVLALLRLALLLAGSPIPRGRALLAALTGGDMASVYLATGPGDAEILAPLLRCPASWLQEVGQMLLARPPSEMVDEAAMPPARRYTQFGGIFLLLPLLDELPLAEATHGWPDPEEVSAAMLVRFLLLIKCCGQSHAHSAFDDPLVRDVMAIPPSLSPAVLANWSACMPPGSIGAFLDLLASWQSERGTVLGETLVLAHVTARRTPLAVLLDGERGVWLCVDRHRSHRLEHFLKFVRSGLSLGTWEGTIVLSDPAFIAALHTAFPGLKVVSLLDAVSVAVEDNSPLGAILARLDKLPGDLAYLSCPRSFGLSHVLDHALSVAAQGVMRAFAWRLPGFAGSNLPYLYSNFLDCVGSLEEEPARRVVRLGRPPLHLVLSMTGTARGAYRVSWLDERPLALFPEG